MLSYYKTVIIPAVLLVLVTIHFLHTSASLLKPGAHLLHSPTPDIISVNCVQQSMITVTDLHHSKIYTNIKDAVWQCLNTRPYITDLKMRCQCDTALTLLCKAVANIDGHAGICDLPAWPAWCSSSQTVNIWRTRVLLCRTFSLEHPDVSKSSALTVPTFRRQLKHFYFSQY